MKLLKKLLGLCEHEWEFEARTRERHYNSLLKEWTTDYFCKTYICKKCLKVKTIKY